MRRLRVGPSAVALLDDEDYERASAYRWHLGSSGSAQRTAPAGGTIFLQREITGATEGQRVVFWDGNPLNCQRANLRACSHADSMAFKKKRRSKSSAYKGVSRERRGWVATIEHDGVARFLGRFATEVEAAAAYDAAALDVFREFAQLNLTTNPLRGPLG